MSTDAFHGNEGTDTTENDDEPTRPAPRHEWVDQRFLDSGRYNY